MIVGMYDYYIHHFSGGPLHLTMTQYPDGAPETIEFPCTCADNGNAPRTYGVVHYTRTAIWAARDDERTLHAMYRHDRSRGDCDCR